MEDVPGFRFVGRLDGAERERALAAIGGRQAAWRKRAGLVPVPRLAVGGCGHPSSSFETDSSGVLICTACGDAP